MSRSYFFSIVVGSDSERPRTLCTRSDRKVWMRVVGLTSARSVNSIPARR